MLGLPATFIAGCVQHIAGSSSEVQSLLVYALGDIGRSGISDIMFFLRVMVAVYFVYSCLSISIPKDDTPSHIPPQAGRTYPPARKISAKEEE